LRTTTTTLFPYTTLFRSNFVITTYDSNGKTFFWNGRRIKHQREKYKRLRKQLQQKRTPSARRRLKAIGQRENRWMQDVNHCISRSEEHTSELQSRENLVC